MAKQYITEINKFYEFVRINGLTASEIALFSGLLQINNRCMWTEWFTAAISELEVISGINTNNIYKVRNRLKQWGLIEVQSRGGNKSAKYKICNYGMMNFTDGVQPADSRRIDGVQPADSRRIALIDIDKDKDNLFLLSDARAGEVCQSYEENIGVLTGMIFEELEGYTELMCPEAVIYAIKQAALNNKKSCSYVKRICQNLLNEGVKTPLDLERHIKRWEEQKQRKSQQVEASLEEQMTRYGGI